MKRRSRSKELGIVVLVAGPKKGHARKEVSLLLESRKDKSVDY